MGRLIGLLLVLNGVMLVAGLSLEQVRGQPAALVDFNADKVRLLGRVEQADTEPAQTPATTIAVSEEALATAKPPEATVSPPRDRCVSWPGLDQKLLGEIEGLLRGAGITDAQYEIQLEKRLGWWVYLPPFASAAAAQAAIESAREKGVVDIAVVRGGDMANAVSLGAFPSLAKARAHLSRVSGLGVNGARAGPRPNSGAVRVSMDDSVPDASLVRLSAGWGKAHAPAACAGR